MEGTMAQGNLGYTQAARGEAPYPVQFSVEYPEFRNRLTDAGQDDSGDPDHHCRHIRKRRVH